MNTRNGIMPHCIATCWIAALAMFGGMSNVMAASIAWTDQGAFTDNTVLELAGASTNEAYGVSFGGAGSQVTANGYTFDDYAVSGNFSVAGSPSSYDSYLSGGGSTGDFPLDLLLTYGIYGATNMTGILQNLTVGQTYTVMALLADTRAAHGGIYFRTTDGTSYSPQQQYSYIGGTPSVAGYIMGTFTADSTNQAFSVQNLSVSGTVWNGQYNAILLVKSAPPVYPAIQIATNIQPATSVQGIAGGVGGDVTFTVAFSNSPAVNIQWQRIMGGATNNVSTGTVNNTTNGQILITSFTLTNLQLADAGQYLAKAIDATNSLNFKYSSAASLSVHPLIYWMEAGTFTDNTVLELVGDPTNEVYGVDFGGSGFQTTANGYTFDDYTFGNMDIAGSGFGLYNSYLGGGGTTGDSALDVLLTYGLYGSAQNTGTLKNLSAGQTYYVLALLADTRGAPTAGTAFHATDGVTHSPNQVEAFTGGAPAMGGYALGRFTAVSSNQPFSLITQTLAGDYNNSQYNLILVAKAPAPTNPPIYTVSNTVPESATAAEGAQVTFSASYWNSLALNFQWWSVTNGVTNSLSTGVVNTTNGAVITTAVTLTDLQVADSGSYWVEVTDATNSLNQVSSSPATLTVIPVITWTSSGSFTDNSVLALVGAPANVAYAVDFGGSGPQTTANGYAFDDYITTGNISISGAPGSFGGYMTGGATTGDAAFDTVLTFGIYGGTAESGMLNNLTPGQTYNVLALLDDTRGAAAGGRYFRTTDGATVSAGQEYAFTNGLPAVGGYILGTFTADSSTQSFSVRTSQDGSNFGSSQYNAIILAVAPSVPTAPIVNSPTIEGGNLIVTGTGGTPGSSYSLLQTTNLTPPVVWTTNLMGTLDGAGSFSNAVPVDLGQPEMFFRLQLP